MTQVTFDPEIPSQLAQIRDAMQITAKSKSAEVALQILELRRSFLENPAKHYDSIRQLQIKNPKWIILEFVQASHLSSPSSGLEQLKSLYCLSSKVYLVASDILGQEWEAEFEELADELYRLLEEIQFLEVQPSNTLKYAGALGAAALAGAMTPIAAPLAAGGVLALSWLRRVTSAPLLQDRPRNSQVEFHNLHNNVRYFYEPESSGLIGRTFTNKPSKTIGQLEIDLENGEAFSCYFDESAKHKVLPSDVQRLHAAMLRAFRENKANPTLYLDILNALDGKFLDENLALCLVRIKTLCNRAKVASDMPPQKPLEATTTDVPGYKNSCGLFALALAAWRKKKLPKNLQQWDEACFSAKNKDTLILEEIHSFLRDELAISLMANSLLQENIRERFIMACHLKVTSGCSLPDMEPFLTSNDAFIRRVKAADYKRFILTDEELPRYIEMVESAAISSELPRMQKRIRTFFDAHPKPADRATKEAFRAIIEDFFQNEIDPLIRIIKQRKLYLATVISCQTLEMRQWWRKEAQGWLESKFLQLLTTSQDTVHLYRLFTLLFRMDVAPNGRDFAFPQENELLESTLPLFLLTEIHSQWGQLFANYVLYLQGGNCMLTADELQALATKWGLEIVVLDWVQKIQSSPSDAKTVYLKNPSHTHWMAASIQ